MSRKSAKTHNPVAATKPERKEWTGQAGDIVLVPLEDVHLPEDYLEPSQVSVAEIAESIQTFGLIHPIAVRLHPIAFGKRRETLLIAGATRFAAYKLLGERMVPCTYFPDDEIAAKYIRMSENIFRADITVLDKADKIAEYLKFLKEHQLGDFGQNVQKQGRPLSEAGKAAKQLPIAAKTIESRKKKIDRYLKISQSILDEHKPLIREKGLANNQWALLQIANEEDRYQKYKAIQRLGARRTTPRAAIKKRMNQTMPVAEHAKYEELLAAWEASPEFKAAWRKAEPEHRDRFYNEVMCGLSHYDSDQAVRLVQRAFAGREKILVRHLQRLGRKHGYHPSVIINVAKSLGYKKKRLSQNRNEPWWYINPNPDWKDGFPLISQKEFEAAPNLDDQSVRSYDDGDDEDFQQRPVQYNDDDDVVTSAGPSFDEYWAELFPDDEIE